MRRTMVGVAPAANTPPPLDAFATVATTRDAASGHESADTAVALPPEMIKALGEMTLLSEHEPPVSGPSSAPMTKRMSEAPTAAAPAAAGGAPTAAPSPRSSPSVAPSAPSPSRSPSVAPPRVAPTVMSAKPGASTVVSQGAPPTDPMAAPLERKPLVTTYALSPIAVVPGAPPVLAAPPPPDPPAPLVVAPIHIVGSGTRASAAPPAFASVPPAAGTIKGMPLASASAPPAAASPAPLPAPAASLAPPAPAPPAPAHSPLPMPASMPVRGDETMVLAPPNAAVPLAPTVSMPPMPPAMPAGMPHVAGGSSPSMAPRTGAPVARPSASGPQLRPSTPKAFSPNNGSPLSPPPFIAAPPALPAWTPPAPLAPPPSPSPSLAETRSPDDGRAPLTYQVFNPSAPALARPSAPSRVSYPEERSSSASVGLRVCLVLLGVCVVVGTAGAIILSST
ncbi:MAG TPA: hypothetical protein VLT33_48415, partial [Labilithrix sp.]|nr:hypothetical protein [Labilithrix sp.]